MPNKISVAMATYNGERYIEEQLKSILCQLAESDEIIISDNYSDDKTIEIIKSLNDNRIKLFSSKKISKDGRINCIKNFENALSKCSGFYIFLCDQDDIWHKNKIRICCEYLNAYDLVVSDCCVVNEEGNCITESYFKERKSGKGLFKNLLSNTYLGCCMAFKRDVLSVAIPFPKLIPMHDIYLGFVSELFFRSVFINEVLVFYRSHSLNVSPTSRNVSEFNFFQKFLFRFNTVRQLPALLFKYFKK